MVFGLQVDVFTMNEFFESLPASELRRISSLEYFDEYEEWHLKCFHYVIILARSTGSNFPMVENTIFSIKQHNSGI